MTDRTINATFIPRRDTAANWESENPVLREGEYISVTTNAGAIRHKVGDGVKTYNQLPFIDEPLYNAMSDKADKVSSPTSGNFAALDSNGNLTDSGHKHSDYLTSHQDISGKQDLITAEGILEGDGEGNISAADTVSVSTISNPSSNGTYVLQNTVSGGTSTLSWASGSASSGTVTSVGVSNDTNGGLSVSGSPITNSGTITIGHSNVLTNAQTTEAVYPIKIDKNGHISSYGSAVTIPDVSGKIDTAGTGLSKSGTTLNHSNSVTAQTTQAVYPITIDAQGHINSYGTAVAVPTNIPKQGTWYGTCSTTASTAQKDVTCSGFELTAGNIIGVLFTTANTAATPTLNVNSTTTKSIYIGNSAPNSTDNVLKWSANTMVYFVYDGTYYRYITSVSAGAVVPSRGANTWYGTSSTGATTQAKTSTIDNFVLTKGAVVCITFSTANTYTSAKITLNINSTGAKDVYYNNAVTSSTNTLLWNAGETITFVYSGSYYYFVSRSVFSVASATTGISVADHSTTTIYGVGSSTTTASKATGANGSAPTLGTAISVPNVTSAGSASNWVFEDVTVPKAATSATTVPIKNTNATSIPNVTAVGSGSFGATVTNHVLSFSHTHTAPTLGTAISVTGVQSSTTSVTGVSGSVTGSHVKSGGNGTAPTLGTAISVPNVTSVGSASTWSFSDVTVPIKNSSSTTVVTSKTHSVTDNGHTHALE